MSFTLLAEPSARSHFITPKFIPVSVLTMATKCHRHGPYHTGKRIRYLLPSHLPHSTNGHRRRKQPAQLFATESGVLSLTINLIWQMGQHRGNFCRCAVFFLISELVLLMGESGSRSPGTAAQSRNCGIDCYHVKPRNWLHQCWRPLLKDFFVTKMYTIFITK